MMWKQRLFPICLILVFSVLAASGPVCAQSKTPGVTDDSITIGILVVLAGPAAKWGEGPVIAADMYLKKRVNEAGGVHGRKIKWIIENDEGSPPKGIAGYKKLVDKGVFAIWNGSTSATVAAMRPTMDALGVPTIITQPSTPRCSYPFAKNVFHCGPVNDTFQGALIADFVVKNLGKKRIAVMSQSDEYGQRGAKSVTKRLQEKYGITLVAHEWFKPSDTDFTSQVLKVRDAHPEAVIIYSYVPPSVGIVRQAKQFGLDAKIIGSNATSSRAYPKLLGDVAAGVLNIITAPDLPESDAPRIAEWREEFEKAKPSLVAQARPDLSDLLGYGGAITIVEGLKRAGRDLTREKFIAALETLRGFETGFILPTTWTPTDHAGNKAARILEILPGGRRKLLDVILRYEE